MGRGIDLKGQTFNRLTALEEVGRQQGQLLWRCKCVCGQIVVVPSSPLRNGKTRSCGCLRTEMLQNRRKYEERACVKCNATFLPISKSQRFCNKSCWYATKLGVPQSAETIEKRKAALGSGESHHSWKGDKVGYDGLHKWVESKLGRPSHCLFCGSTGEQRYEWANISYEYKRDISDWMRLCTTCHRRYDSHHGKNVKRRDDFETHCKNGHEYAVVGRYESSNGKCRECQSITSAKYYKNKTKIKD